MDDTFRRTTIARHLVYSTVLSELYAVMLNTDGDPALVNRRIEMAHKAAIDDEGLSMDGGPPDDMFKHAILHEFEMFHRSVDRALDALPPAAKRN